MSITKKEKEELQIGISKKMESAAKEKDPQDVGLEKEIEMLTKDIAKEIRIIAHQGYVNLTGIVYNRDYKSRIDETVKSIPGVKEVTNHLRVVAEED